MTEIMMTVRYMTGRFWHGLATRCLKVLTDPFIYESGLFLCMCAMLTALPYAFFQLLNTRSGPYVWSGVPVFLGGAVVIVWFMLLVYGALKSRCRRGSRVWLTLCLMLLTLNWMSDLFLVKVYETEFSCDLAAVIAATNPDEACEFLHTNVRLPLLFSGLKYMTLFGTLYWLGGMLGRYVRGLPFSRVLTLRWVSLGVLAVASSCSLFMDPNVMIENGLWGKCISFMSLEPGHAIVPADPSLELNPSDTPDHIVVVLGESHSATRSSLYGCETCTQPCQESLAADSSLYVFASPKAPELSTLKSLRYLIGTWQGEENRNWYECPTFLEIADKAGYLTLWLSNQSPKGVYDNPVYKIAEFADIHEFTNNGMSGLNSSRFDEYILPLLDKHFDAGRRDLTVLHLIGSHTAYASRFPSGFARFHAADYTYRPENQRQVLADYDNSILYNDYVLSNIYKRYGAVDAVVLYLSDHGQDLFDSSPEFFGHAKADVPASKAAGEAVPFTVWLSPVFRARHPRVAARIAAATSRPVALTDLTYTLMDLMGARFADNDDVAARSFFRPL